MKKLRLWLYLPKHTQMGKSIKRGLLHLFPTKLYSHEHNGRVMPIKCYMFFGNVFYAKEIELPTVHRSKKETSTHDDSGLCEFLGLKTI